MLFGDFYKNLFYSTALLLITACGDSDSEPRGALRGKFTPKGSIERVTMTGTEASGEAVPAADGTFTINSLRAGQYTLHLTPANGYTAPADTTITITAGETKQLPDLPIFIGSFFCKINGRPFSGTANKIGAVLLPGAPGRHLVIIAESIASSEKFQIEVIAKNPIVNHYPLTNRYDFIAYYSRSESMVAMFDAYDEIWITKADSIGHRLSGTFRCGVSSPGGQSSKSITDGTFTNLPFAIIR